MTTVATISVELTPYEIRALRNAAGWWEDILTTALPDECEQALHELPDGVTVPPLQSAAMKLETALMTEGEDL